MDGVKPAGKVGIELELRKLVKVWGLPLLTSACVFTLPPSNMKLLLIDQPFSNFSLSSEPK